LRHGTGIGGAGMDGADPSVTRLVQLYSAYEQRLAEAASRKNNGEFDRLVASDLPANNIGGSRISLHRHLMPLRLCGRKTPPISFAALPS
jgi:hypothetical protein